MRELANDEVQVVAGGFRSAHIDGGGNEDLFVTQTVTVTGGSGANAFYALRAMQYLFAQGAVDPTGGGGGGSEPQFSDEELRQLRGYLADQNNINSCEWNEYVQGNNALILGAIAAGSLVVDGGEPVAIVAGVGAALAALAANGYGTADDLGWCGP